MKNLIVTIAEIFLGVALFMLIFGGEKSLRSEAGVIFNRVVNQMENLKYTK